MIEVIKALIDDSLNELHTSLPCKITAINFALSNLIGYEKEEVLGYHPKFLFAGQSDDNAYKTFIKELVKSVTKFCVSVTLSFFF